MCSQRPPTKPARFSRFDNFLMLFTTWTFAALLLVTLIFYYLVPKFSRAGEAQIGVLVISSMVFYAYETPVLIILLVFSILINSYHSMKIIQAQEARRCTKVWTGSAVAINLLLLGFFKYAGFLAHSFIPDGVLRSLVADLGKIPLPVGISFYSFQAISLVVDLHREESSKMTTLVTLAGEGRFWRFTHRVGFFIAFFPQLVAGPIVKAHDFFHQIGAKVASDINWSYAVKSFIAGLFLKMVVADNLKEVTVLLGQGLITHRIDLIFLVYGYSFQIFADFAGYSLIAIGLASMFGYRLSINFNFPYLSASITEFWQRWHISLSTWLKEYLYFPLGGNRRGAARTYFNLFVVMLLGGLWHGAAWSYVAWGASHGLFLAAERLISGKFKPFKSPVVKCIQVVVVFHVVSFLWLLFLLPDFKSLVSLGGDFAQGRWQFSPQNIFTVAVFSAPIVLYHGWFALKRWRPAIGNLVSPSIQWWGYAVLVFLIITNSGTTGAFVYFQF